MTTAMASSDREHSEPCTQQLQQQASTVLPDHTVTNEGHYTSLITCPQQNSVDRPRMSSLTKTTALLHCHHNHTYTRSPPAGDRRASFPSSPGFTRTRKCSRQMSPGCSSSQSLPNEQTLQKYMLTIVVVVVVSALVVVTVVAVTVFFSGDDAAPEGRDLSRHDMRFIEPMEAREVVGRVSVTGGPLGIYNHSLANGNSSFFSFVARSFEYQIMSAFQHSLFRDIFHHCKVTAFSPGAAVNVEFRVHFTPHLVINTLTLSELSQAVINATLHDMFGVFRINRTTVVFDIPVTNSSPDGGVKDEARFCRPISADICRNVLPYDNTVSVVQAIEEDSQLLFHSYVRSRCHKFASQFACALFNPQCRSDAITPPCRGFCEDVVKSCSSLRKLVETSIGSCSLLPSYDSSADVCFQPAAFGASRCEKTDFDMCTKLGLPDVVQIHYPKERFYHVLEMAYTFGCYEHIKLFGCAFLRPPCKANTDGNDLVYETKPMCQELCVEAFDHCGFFFQLIGADWTKDIDCFAFPLSNETTECVGPEHAAKIECADGYRECDGSRCVPRRWWCDGKHDCVDGTDEEQCARCEEETLRCEGHVCIPNTLRCDGTIDCLQEEDEECVRVREDGWVEMYNVTSEQWHLACSDSVQIPQLHKGLNRRLKGVGYSFENRTLSPLESSMAHCSYSAAYVGEVDFSRCVNTLPDYLTSTSQFSVTELDPGDWPWIVSLHGGKGRAFFCAGVIIDARWVLTAAHCVHRKTSVEGWTVIAGHGRRRSHNPQRQVRQVKRIIPHPAFRTAASGDDVALIEMDVELKLNQFVRSICLPPMNYSTTPGNQCLLGGWGKMFSIDTEYSEVLKLRKLTVLSPGRCYNRLHGAATFSLDRDSITENICATGMPTADACDGDSGGPMLCPGPDNTWVLAGIVSWGLKCGDASVPGVNTDVVRYLPWINASLGDDLPQTRYSARGRL